MLDVVPRCLFGWNQETKFQPCLVIDSRVCGCGCTCDVSEHSTQDLFKPLYYCLRRLDRRVVQLEDHDVSTLNTQIMSGANRLPAYTSIP